MENARIAELKSQGAALSTALCSGQLTGSKYDQTAERLEEVKADLHSEYKLAAALQERQRCMELYKLCGNPDSPTGGMFAGFVEDGMSVKDAREFIQVSGFQATADQNIMGVNRED